MRKILISLVFMATLVTSQAQIKARISTEASNPRHISTKTIGELYPRAKKGNTKAQAELGRLYLSYAELDGKRTPKKVYSLAKKWLTLASKKGNKTAKADLKKANTLLEIIKRAEKGNREGQFELAYAFDIGRTNDKNLPFIRSNKLAMKWYKEAAKKKHPVAANNIATMYEAGQGVKQSFPQAYKWYRVSASSGYTPAQKTLALYYEQGIGTKKSYKKAIYWYKKAAAKGVVSAQNRLGMYYLEGKGIKKSAKKAFNLFLKAARKGDAHAQYNLGNAYVKGRGTKKNSTTAYAWLYLASTQMGVGEFNAYSDFDALRETLSEVSIRIGMDKVKKLKKKHNLQ